MRTLRLLLAWTVMLALVGGLGGTVLAQDDATEQSLGDPLPGVELVTEQVEPGVYRVVNDGVRELSNPLGLDDFFARCCWEPPGDVYRHSAFEANDIVASEAGVWLRDPEGIIRLGKAEPVWAPDDGDGTPEFKAAPDGTLYQPRSRRVLEGDDWVEMKLRLGRFGLREIEEIMFAHDGSLWVLGDTGKGGGEPQQRLARRDAEGWSRISPPPPPPAWLRNQRERAREGRSTNPVRTNGRLNTIPTIGDWAVTPDGSLYVKRHKWLQRFDGTDWESLERPGQDPDLHVGPDDAVWVSSRRPDAEWPERQVTRFGTEEGATISFEQHPLFGQIRAVGADGAFWYAALGHPLTSGGCGGIARTDGTTTTTFLDGLCVYDVAIGPNGGVWLQAGSWDGDYFVPDAVGPVETYVISVDAEGTSE